MTIQHSLLSSSDFTSIWEVLSKEELRLKLDPTYGGEKIVTSDGEQTIDLMEASCYIHSLTKRNLKELSEEEIECGRKVCEVFRKFWYQLKDELKELTCVASTLYRVNNWDRYVTIISDMNVEWFALWQGNNPDVMLRPSWYILDAIQELGSNKAH